MLKVSIIFLLTAVSFAAGQTLNSEGDVNLELLLKNVNEIAAPGVPGPLCVYGERAFPVATGNTGDTIHEPVIAAGKMGKGRVVAFGHTGYLDVNSLKIADTHYKSNRST